MGPRTSSILHKCFKIFSKASWASTSYSICVHDYHDNQEQYLKVTYNIQGQSNHHLVVIKWEHGPSNHLRVLFPGHQATNDHRMGHLDHLVFQCPYPMSLRFVIYFHLHTCLLWLHVMSSHFTFVINVVSSMTTLLVTRHL